MESVDTIIIACTDLNIVLNKIDINIHIIDSAKSLAESIIKKYLDK
jgi:aspartate racemase